MSSQCLGINCQTRFQEDFAFYEVVNVIYQTHNLDRGKEAAVAHTFSGVLSSAHQAVRARSVQDNSPEALSLYVVA